MLLLRSAFSIDHFLEVRDDVVDSVGLEGVFDFEPNLGFDDHLDVPPGQLVLDVEVDYPVQGLTCVNLLVDQANRDSVRLDVLLFVLDV